MSLPFEYMSKSIDVQINFFGPFIKKEEVSKMLDPALSPVYQFQIDLLEAFFELPFVALSKDVLTRYLEVTAEDCHVPIVPHSEEIYDRLLIPLKLAKKHFCFEEYLTVVAACGVGGEMLAILLWKINEPKLKGKPISTKDEIGLFGFTFEKLGQKRKLEVLLALGVINEVQHQKFTDIKKSREKYLHLWDKSSVSREKQEALKAYKNAFQLFKQVTGIGLNDGGTIKVNPLLLKFLNARKEIE